MDTDQLTRALFPAASSRVALVQLQQSWQQVLACHHYPSVVKGLLGEMLAATALLASTIKNDGRLKMEIRGQGPVTLVAIECGAEGQLRGLARSQPEVTGDNLQAVTGGGLLVITSESASGQRYQGIVALEGDSLASVLECYFRDSEQLPTRFWLSADDNCASALLLQQLPGEREEDSWERLQYLAETVTTDELVSLPARDLLHRLFHQEELHYLQSQQYRFECSCSLQRVTEMLISLGRVELEETLDQEGVVEVNCEFCNRNYRFGAEEVARLFGAPGEPRIH